MHQAIMKQFSEIKRILTSYMYIYLLMLPVLPGIILIKEAWKWYAFQKNNLPEITQINMFSFKVNIFIQL